MRKHIRFSWRLKNTSKSHTSSGGSSSPVVRREHVLALTIHCRRSFRGTDLETCLRTAALIANITCLALLLKHRHDKANILVSLICSINDVVANTGIILSEVIAQVSGSRVPNLIIGLIIAVVVGRGAVQYLTEARRAVSDPTCKLDKVER